MDDLKWSRLIDSWAKLGTRDGKVVEPNKSDREIKQWIVVHSRKSGEDLQKLSKMDLERTLHNLVYDTYMVDVHDNIEGDAESVVEEFINHYAQELRDDKKERESLVGDLVDTYYDAWREVVLKAMKKRLAKIAEELKGESTMSNEKEIKEEIQPTMGRVMAEELEDINRAIEGEEKGAAAHLPIGRAVMEDMTLVNEIMAEKKTVKKSSAAVDLDAIADESRGFPEEFLKRAKSGLKRLHIFVFPYPDADSALQGMGVIDRPVPQEIYKDRVIVAKSATNKPKEGEHVFLSGIKMRSLAKGFIEKVDGDTLYIIGMGAEVIEGKDVSERELGLGIIVKPDMPEKKDGATPVTERSGKGFIENHPDLAEQLKNAIDGVKDQLEKSPASGGYETSGEIEEVEHESRDGFMSTSDGGYKYAGFVQLDHLFGSGSIFHVTKKAEKHIQHMYDYGLEIAKEGFVKKYAKELEGIPEDKINYHDLYDMKKNDLAEKLSEMEDEVNADETVMFLILSFMEDETDRDAGITFNVQSAINWESPYHRSGENHEDYKTIEVEFKNAEDMKKNFGKVLKAVETCGKFLFGK